MLVIEADRPVRAKAYAAMALFGARTAPGLVVEDTPAGPGWQHGALW